MLIKAICIVFKISSPKIRVRGLFDGAEYSHIYGISVFLCYFRYHAMISTMGMLK